MLKFSAARLAACIFLLTVTALAGGVVVITHANSVSSSWIDAPLYLSKVADVSAAEIPSTFFGSGNTNCTYIYEARCSIQTPYGAVSGSSVWLDGKWRSIRDYGGSSLNFFAIPNSDTAFTTSSSPGFGSYIYFTDNVSLALTPHYAVGSPDLGAGLGYFQLNRIYDRKLIDKSGNRLTADLNSMAFSGNSQWMVVTEPGIANLRVNVNTGEVLPFGKAFSYGYGQNPIPKNAITSDGRYALEASKDTANFTIYDLSACDNPSDIHPANCAGRELIYSGYLSSHIPGYTGTLYARFINDSTLKFYVSYKESGTTKFAEYTLSTDPDAINGLQYLALGDSYISGEGTFDYMSGTDTDTNRCHLSLYSYPYLIGHDLNFDSFNSVACSGAITNDLTDTSDSYDGQTSNGITKTQLENSSEFSVILGSFSPGWIDQLEFVNNYQPQAITVSIGGNDMGFSNIVYRCTAPWYRETCYDTYEDRLELVRAINESVFPKLVDTYTRLKNAGPADMRIYAIGYPQIALPGGNCAINVQLNKDELIFAQKLINYLNGVIKDAADKAGAEYVDTQDALYGHRLCEAGPGSIAMNGITAGNDRPSILGGPLGDESYHPSKLGYRLLEEKILSETHNLSDPIPPADPSAAPPVVSPDLEILSGVQSSGRTVNQTEYDPTITANFAYRGTSINVSIDGAVHFLGSGTTLSAELHSDPLNLGSFQTDNDHNLVTEIPIPVGTETGYHVLHFYGSDLANKPIDIYKTIYVASTADDIDGNGIPDSQQACVGVPESGQDYDQDGIDDACDGDIGLPPAGTSQSSDAQTSQTSGNSANEPGANDAVTRPAIAGPQEQTGANGINVADSASGEVKPKVLAAETTNTASKNPVDIKPSNDYWLAAVGLPILVGLAYAAKRLV